MGYRQIDHTADVGLEVTADTLPALFSEAAAGMFSLIVSGDTRRPVETRRIAAASGDYEGLIVDWLRELLYLWHAERRRFRAWLDGDVTPYAVAATVSVDSYNPNIHVIENEIKAVTYHQIAVINQDGRWRTRIIFDV
jgi:SHS2 domain-containing protein